VKAPFIDNGITIGFRAEDSKDYLIH